MAISQYWVGQIPARPISIDVRDSFGRAVNLSNYNEFKVRILGSDNEEVDTTGLTVVSSGASEGRFVLRWPSGRSLFNKSGEYLLQMILIGPNARDITTEHTIRVRELGKAGR